MFSYKLSSMRLPLRAWAAFTLVAILAAPAARAGDIPGRLGGGNIESGRDLQKGAKKLEVLRQLGAGMCRIPVSAHDYWAGPQGAPHPERLDALIKLAHAHGVTPILLFEYYTRHGGELGGHDKWFKIGQAYAGRFKPGSEWLRSQGIRGWGVTFYSAINEPMWRANNPAPIPPDQYALALEGLADGVHAADPGLHVNPGGYQEVPLFQNKNPYIKAVAPLFNSGKLFAIGIHRYWDVDYVPMAGKYNFSLQSQFEQVKRNAGITADVAFYTDEINFKKRRVSEEEAAQGFLTALWDALGVVGQRGQVVSQFVLPWNIFNLTTKDQSYGLCTQLSPWTPTARGRVLALVCELTRGMDFTAAAPKGKGEYVLEGGGRKLWVWQNRKAWTNHSGSRFTVEGIPTGVQELKVYAWDGLKKTIPVSGSAMSIEGLTEGQTWMILAVPAGN